MAAAAAVAAAAARAVVTTQTQHSRHHRVMMTSLSDVAVSTDFTSAVTLFAAGSECLRSGLSGPLTQLCPTVVGQLAKCSQHRVIAQHMTQHLTQ